MKTPLRMLAVALVVMASFVTASAVCNQSSASMADQDLWDTHGCWEEFYLFSYRAYDQSEGDWADRGWFDSCNINFEWPKHWNAAYLVTYGLLDNSLQSFHGTGDYRGTGEAASSNYHSSLYHSASDDTCCFAQFTFHPFGANEIETMCGLYNATSTNGNPASRAGDFMHEGWHAWAWEWGWSFGDCRGHNCGPIGACPLENCDYFYFHGIGEYEFGAMYENDGTARRFHSPNQVQVEFLCDVADQSMDGVPDSVRRAARADANQRAMQRFINGPGYRCGDPRPW